MKKEALVSNWYREGTIEIPYTRLRHILKKGDIIYGNGGCKISAIWVGYRVTHIDWWGVYAVPTDKMLAEYGKNYRGNIKKHYKFKWRHITGIKFL